MVKIGFTGTRDGASYEAHNTLRTVVQALKPLELHHGDCIGADSEAHSIARRSVETTIVIHPPDVDDLRAYRAGDVLKDPLPYLERNHHIVDDTNVLIAVPKTSVEIPRSGTWATVRYAIKQSKPVMVIKPTGEIQWM